MYNSKDWSWFAPCINDQGGWQVKQKDSLMRSLLFRGVLLAALGVAVLGGATDDYSLSIEGPRTAYAGYDVYVRVNIQFTGPVGHVYFSAVDEPAGISHEIICHSGTGNCWKGVNNVPYIWNTASATDATFRFIVAADMEPGLYRASVTTTALGVAHLIEIPIQVMAVPAFQATRPELVPPIPGLQRWQQIAETGGKKWCKPDALMNWGWEQDVWYYDGARVFFQLADYTGDNSWEACAFNIARQYRDKVLAASGYMPGWRVFPHGLRMAYGRTGDETYRQALFQLAQKGAYATTAGAVTDDLIRETAYAAEAYIEAERAGAERNPLLGRAIGYLLGHYEMVFEDHHYRIHQPFFDGLAAEALISYYELTGDPRIPGAIRRMLDWMWDYGWDHHTKSLVYDPDTIPRTYATDLVNLVAPAFAWYYSVTGDDVYRRRGDELFQRALDNDVTYSGKNFNQNFRWSYAYVNWRRSTVPVGVTLPERASAGVPLEGEVLIGQPAVGPCGRSVRLSSSDPAAIHLPGSVKLAAGAVSAAVKADLQPVDQERAITVTASYTHACGDTGSSFSIPVRVTPDELRILLNATRQGGGTFANNRVILEGVTPAAGYTVELGTDRPDLVSFRDENGPISALSIALGGYATDYFLIETGYVTEPTEVTITAVAKELSAGARLTIMPPWSRIALLSGPTVTGGGTTRLNQVVLSAPAPPGGATVELASSNAALQVPSTVQIPEGAIAADFAYQTAVLAKFTPVKVTARYGSEVLETTVNINALLLGMSLPAKLNSGASGTGTLSLSSAAPDDVAVQLTTPTGSPLQVPPSIIIPKGQKKATFEITAGAVTAITQASVVATIGDQAQSGSLTVQP